MIYLHIGRNKAGSTTLQDFFLSHRGELEALGVRYALFGHFREPHPDVLGFGSGAEVGAYARAHPDKTLLISNEFLALTPRDFVEGFARALSGLETRILFYTRDYAGWLRSSYGFDVRIGWNARDIDAYFEWILPKITAWPALASWGEAFGWDNVRVRALDTAALRSGDLISDCLDAVGVDPQLGKLDRAPPSNTALPWMATEFTRALIAASNETGWDEAEMEVVATLQNVLLDCIEGSPNRAVEAQYFTPAQETYLAELYDADVANISRSTMTQVANALRRKVAARPFLPSWRNVPGDILAQFARRVSDPQFARQTPICAAAAARARALLNK